jgi:predicted nucleotidyltransferase
MFISVKTITTMKIAAIRFFRSIKYIGNETLSSFSKLFNLKLFTILLKNMVCRLSHPLETLLKADERGYIIAAAYREKKKTRKEIRQETVRLFKPNTEREIKEKYGVTLKEYVDRLVEIENQTFGSLEEAFVPSRMGYEFVPENKLKKAKKQLDLFMKAFSKSEGNYRIISEEIEGSTTETRRRLFSQCGLTLVEHSGLSRKEWMEILNNFTEFAKNQPYVSSLYLTGSLARGVDFSKDADVVVIRNACPDEKCELFELSHKHDPRFGRVMPIVGEGFIVHSTDVYCFSENELKILEDGKYRIVQNKQLLFQR